MSKTYSVVYRDHILGHELDQVKLVLNQAEKLTTEPLFKEEYFISHRTWEVRYDNGYPNVIYDTAAKQFRCYYTTFIKDDFSANASLKQRTTLHYQPQWGRVVGLCVAISDDGIFWIKPELNLVEFEGSKANNIVMLFAHGSSVLYDEDEVDPTRRYKLMTKIEYSPTDRYMAVAFSADGLSFSQPIRWKKHNPQADTHNYVLKDHISKEFHLITRIWKNGLRITAKSTSKDFLDWSEPVEILRGHGFKHQVYSMPILQTDEGYLGIPSIYHEGNRSHKAFDTVDVTLAFSKDAHHWDFVDIEQPLIQRGEGEYPTGAFDCGCIYAASPLLVNEEYYIYYMGGNGRHTDFRETGLGLTKIHSKKLAYVQPLENQRGTFCSAPMYLTGSSFYFTMKDGDLDSMKISICKRNGESALTANDFTISQQGFVYTCLIHVPSKAFYQQQLLLKIEFQQGKLYHFGGDIDILIR